MKTLFFNKNNLKNKLMTQLGYWVFVKHFMKIFNLEIFYWDFFFINIKLKLFLFAFWYQNLILKFVINKLPNIEIFKQKNLILKKRYIQKGIKLNNLGIYIKDLKKNIDINNNEFNYKRKLNYDNEILKNFLNKNSYYYYLIRFKRKNLFLTLLNDQGNVVCKINVGSSGFKKKLKSTSYAIKQTSKKFTKKIHQSLVKNISQILEIKKRKNKKKRVITDYIEDLNIVSKLYNKKKKKIKKKILNIKKENIKKENIKKEKLYWIKKKTHFIKAPFEGNRRQRRNAWFILQNIIKRYNKKINIKLLKNLKIKNKNKNLMIRKKNILMNIEKNKKIGIMNIKKKEEIFEEILIKKKIKKFFFYRDYLYFKDLLKKKLKIIYRIKSNVKFWGNRFVIYGMKKKLRNWLCALEIRTPIPHSTGLRLKKARRL